MLIERLFENLAVTVEPFSVCGVAKGWRLPLPALEWVTLHYVLQGEGTLRVDGKAQRLGRYTLAIVPPRLTHALECGREVRLKAAAPGEGEAVPGLQKLTAGPAGHSELMAACGRIRVTYGGNLGLFDLLREVITLDFSDSPQMRATFEGLLREQGAPAPGSRAMMAALMHQCLVLVFRRLSKHAHCRLPWLAAMDDQRMIPVVDAILARPERPHSLESLAELGHMSRSVFAARFRESFGRTPMDFVRDTRLRQAAQLLHSGELSVDAIASRVGFASRSHFSRAFRDQFGRSPAEFRKVPVEAMAPAWGLSSGELA